MSDKHIITLLDYNPTDAKHAADLLRKVTGYILALYDNLLPSTYPYSPFIVENIFLDMDEGEAEVHITRMQDTNEPTEHVEAASETAVSTIKETVSSEWTSRERLIVVSLIADELAKEKIGTRHMLMGWYERLRFLAAAPAPFLEANRKQIIFGGRKSSTTKQD